MNEFYYQIKGRSNSDYFAWEFPPVFSYKVEAQSVKEARQKIEELYNKKFPMRVLSKDLESNQFLLSIREIKGDEDYINRLWDLVECKECGNKFRRIDLYNDSCTSYKGTEYCSDKCHKSYKNRVEIDTIEKGWDSNGNLPVIYKITNIKTGKCYIGQTQQSFTLRWWQHIKWGNSACKFHQAMIEGEITDWTFQVIEVCKDKTKLNEREQFYINKFNSIEQGYNTATTKAYFEELIEGAHA